MIMAAGGCGPADPEHREDLSAETAAQNARDRVAYCAEALLLQRCPGDIATNCAAHELNQECCDVHPSPRPLRGRR
jgi:hypothetical protein